MDKKTLFIGIAKYFRIGSRGNRHKLVIDDVQLADWMKKEIEFSINKHKINSEFQIINPQDFIRNKRIEVRLE